MILKGLDFLYNRMALFKQFLNICIFACMTSMSFSSENIRNVNNNEWVSFYFNENDDLVVYNSGNIKTIERNDLIQNNVTNEITNVINDFLSNKMHFESIYFEPNTNELKFNGQEVLQPGINFSLHGKVDINKVSDISLDFTKDNKINLETKLTFETKKANLSNINELNTKLNELTNGGFSFDSINIDEANSNNIIIKGVHSKYENLPDLRFRDETDKQQKLIFDFGNDKVDVDIYGHNIGIKLTANRPFLINNFTYHSADYKIMQHNYTITGDANGSFSIQPGWPFWTLNFNSTGN